MKQSSTFNFLENGNILCADITDNILPTKDFWLPYVL